MYKTFEYQILVDVEFADEFDPQYVRDALVFGYEKMREEGYLTALDDETTVCGQMSCVFMGAYEPDVKVDTAPDLLSALENALETIEWMYGCSSPADSEVEIAIAETRAAIANAKGAKNV